MSPIDPLACLPEIVVRTELARLAKLAGHDPRHLSFEVKMELLAAMAKNPPEVKVTAPFPPRRPLVPRNFTKNGTDAVSDSIAGGTGG